MSDDQLACIDLISEGQPIIQLTENGIEGYEFLCRLCANRSDHLIAIYSEEGVTNDLAEKMNLYLPVKVTKSDILPLQCCFQCASTVLAWHELVVASVEADRRLRDVQVEVEKQLAGHDILNETGLEAGTSQEQKEETPEDQDDECTKSLKYRKIPQNVNKTVSDDYNFEKSNNFCNENKNMFTNLDIHKIATTLNKNASTMNSDANKYKFNLEKSRLNHQLNTDFEIYRASKIFTENTKLIIGLYEMGVLKPLELKSSNSNVHNEEKPIIINNKDNIETIQVNNNSNVPAEQSNQNPETFALRLLQPAINTHTCSECHKTFMQKPSLIRHLRIHRNERPFTCHVCGKGFRDESGLNRHIRHVHFRSKSFPCDVCGECFASAATRTDHHRRHTKERPYVCQVCGKTFAARASLFIHAKTHSDVFPFECSVCAKRFRRRQELVAHSTTHTGHKPFECEECGRMFRIRSLLVSHRLVHTDLKPFVCKICGIKYRQLRYLKNHENSKHCRANSG